MHEYSLIQSLLEEVLKQAQQVGAQRVVGVTLQRGHLSDEREDALRFYWEELSRQTLAEGARLHLETVIEELRCLDCDAVFPAEETLEVCPHCAGRRLVSSLGEALVLKQIELDIGD